MQLRNLFEYCKEVVQISPKNHVTFDNALALEDLDLPGQRGNKFVYWKDRARTLEETGGLFMSIVHLHFGCEVIEPSHNTRSFVLIIIFHSCP